MGVVRHLESVATYPELRAAFNAAQPEVSAFYTGIPLDAGLWSNIKAYAATPEAAQLTGARRRFLHKTIETFRRHGADLEPAGKKRLEEIDVELTQITTKFAENVLDSTNAFELGPHQRSRPGRTAAHGHRQRARKRPAQGPGRLALHAASAGLLRGDDRTSTRAPSAARSTRPSPCAGATGDRDNRPILVRIVELRREKAALLGFANFADLVLEDRMAHTGGRALAFLEDLKTKTEHRFREENQELLEFRRSLEGPDAPAAGPVGRRLLRREAAHRALRFRRGGAAPLLPHGARGGRTLRTGAPPLRHPRGRGIRRPRLGRRRALLQCPRRGRRLSGQLLCRLAPARKQARRRLDGRPDHRRSRRRWLPPAPGIDLRQPHAPGRRQARAAHAPRSGDHLPRVRPPVAPPVEPRGNPLAGRHQRRLGFRRTAQPDHGELVLGARGPGPVRAPLRDRRARSRTTCSRR